MMHTQFARLGYTLALSFAVAACSSQSGAPKSSGAAPARSTNTQSARADDASTERARNTSGQDAATTGQRTAATASGEQVEIRQAWVQVRNKPDANAKAIALVFGNDVLSVKGQEGEWVQVQVDKGRTGWIPVAATRP